MRLVSRQAGADSWRRNSRFLRILSRVYMRPQSRLKITIVTLAAYELVMVGHIVVTCEIHLPPQFRNLPGWQFTSPIAVIL